MIHRPDRPDFERFLTALRGGCADRVPVAEALVDNRIKAAVLGRPISNLADDVAFWEKAGYDYICLASGILDPGQAISTEKQLDVTRDRYGTEDEVEWADEGAGQISNMADLETYPWPTVDDLVPAHLTEVARCLPPGMKMLVATGKVFTAVWQMMGYEAFCFAIRDNLSLLEAMFERVARLQHGAFERICGMDAVGGFWFLDDIAYTEGMFVAPKVLRQFVFPWYKRMVDMAHQSGKIAIFHSDGQLWQVLDDIIACGFDALHPIEPKAMDIVEVRRRAQGQLSLIGNIDLDYPLLTGTPEEVRASVREHIATLAPDGGYLLGSANSIPDWIPVENYVAMVQASFEFGRYPILTE